MCVTLAIHSTSCETRRRVVINPWTGVSIFHPTEDPAPCAHSDLARPTEGDCPFHGPCCMLQLWQLCIPGMACQGSQMHHKLHSAELGLFPQKPLLSPRAISELETVPVEHEPVFQMRSVFFDAGAELYQALTIDQWKQAAIKLIAAKQSWDGVAIGQQEYSCPSVEINQHPFFDFLQLCPETYIMLPGAFESFAAEGFDLIQPFTSPQMQILDQITPEDLALGPTPPGFTAEEARLLRAELDSMKQRVAVLEAERDQTNTLLQDSGFGINGYINNEAVPNGLDPLQATLTSYVEPLPQQLMKEEKEEEQEEDVSGMSLFHSTNWDNPSMRALTHDTPISPRGIEEPLGDAYDEFLANADLEMSDSPIDAQFLIALDDTLRSR